MYWNLLTSLDVKQIWKTLFLSTSPVDCTTLTYSNSYHRFSLSLWVSDALTHLKRSSVRIAMFHSLNQVITKWHQKCYVGRMTSTLLVSTCRHFTVYEGRAIADEELIKKSDDWVKRMINLNMKKWFLRLCFAIQAVEETNFCFGRFPRTTYFPETSDLARRTLMLMEGQVWSELLKLGHSL